MDLYPLWISLKTSIIATVFAFFLGITAARWMSGYQGKGKEIIDGVFTLPLVLPPTVVGFLLLLLLGRNSPIGQFLQQQGIKLIFTWYATVIAATVVAFPLMYKTVKGAFEQVDDDLINCARTLGVSEWRLFWLILIPLARSGVVAGTILAFARALGEFGATLMIAGSIPGKTQTIPIAIFFAAEAGKMNEAFNWVLVMVAISLSAIAIINYWCDRQNPQQTNSFQSSPFSKTLLNFLIFGQFRDFKIANQNQISKLARSPLPQQPPELFVTLEKNLPNFQLKTTFTTNQKPLGILGASGSGKSMTLRCLAGLETPNQGRIVLNKRILFDSQQNINLPSRKRRIGFVFQNYALFPHLTIAQNIAFGLQKLPPQKRVKRVSKYLKMMQLQGLENRYPQQISGGQQQRVALARALAIEPELLLLDEPLSALDTYLRSQIEQLLNETLTNYSGVTLFITHKLEEAYRLCHNLLILDQGKVIATGTKQEIFERPPTFKVAQVTECKNFSRAQKIDSQQIQALDWNCNLRVLEPITEQLLWVGIRAHHLTFTSKLNQENTFPCWLVFASETQHRVTLFLKLNQPPDNSQQYHLQAEVYKEKWQEIKDCPFPWYIKLEPLRLIMMAE
ncbi:MAG: molybdate ABC transporter permease subunit [Oscillatoria sp. PMC 1076.18]|nr:molybdate ABC transporter permease subunit [Oscillatoria sp. PMC 1076.18]